MSRGAALDQLWLDVADLDRMTAFYGRALFERPPDMTGDTSAFWTLGRGAQTSVSFALHAAEARAEPGGALAPCFQAWDLERTRGLVLAEGGERIDPDPLIPQGVSRFVGMTVEQRFRDPEGNVVRVYAWTS